MAGQSAAYGFNLTFDLRQSAIDSPFDDSDVVLTGAGLTLAYDTSLNPSAITWTSYSVSLLASSGWRVGSLAGAAATETQMQTVLTNLTGMRIRAEYRTGADTDDLDNVVLNGADTTAIPEPSTLIATGASLLALLIGCRRFRGRTARSQS